MVASIDKGLLLPLADKINHSSISTLWNQYDDSDWLSESELMKKQNGKLQKLICHCYNNVPYYTDLFNKLGLEPDDIKCRQDLSRLPILTKQLIRDNYDKLVSKDAKSRIVFHNSTGGSTGQPLQFLSDKDTWSSAWASSFRAWEWYGFHLGEKIFTLAGNSLVKKGVIKRGFTPKDVFDKVIMRNYKFSSAEMRDSDMKKHYDSFMRLKPAAIRGYASSLSVFAKYIRDNNLPICKIKVILTTGEKLMPEYRYLLQSVFHAPVFDNYGAGDGGISSHECYMHEGLHITEERCIIEIVDNNGNVLPDGKTGYVISTDLDNYAFPFLRYQVGDMAYIKKEKCSCGRSSRLLGEVLGRAGKLVYNKQGEPMSPTMLPMMLYPDLDYHDINNQVLYNKIDKFQIRQDRNGDFVILLKFKNPDEDIRRFDFVVTNFLRYFQGSSVSVKGVSEIPPMPSGKEDYCVSEFEYHD